MVESVVVFAAGIFVFGAGLVVGLVMDQFEVRSDWGIHWGDDGGNGGGGGNGGD